MRGKTTMQGRARVDGRLNGSLVSALHTWLLLILIHRVVAFVRSSLTGIHLLHHNFLRLHALAKLLDWCPRRKGLLELWYECRVDTVGEFDRELDEHVARLVVSH
jgi:hypothetical protein